MRHPVSDEARDPAAATLRCPAAIPRRSSDAGTSAAGTSAGCSLYRRAGHGGRAGKAMAGPAHTSAVRASTPPAETSTSSSVDGVLLPTEAKLVDGTIRAD